MSHWNPLGFWSLIWMKQALSQTWDSSWIAFFVDPGMWFRKAMSEFEPPDFAPGARLNI
jgi:hypothetical protein